MVRFKNRYILAEIRWESNKHGEFTGFQLLNSIKESLSSNFGDFGLGATMTSIQVKYFNTVTNLCIIRTSRDFLQLVWNSITFITQLNKQPASINVLHVGGTIRLCQKAALKYDKQLIQVEDDENVVDS